MSNSQINWQVLQSIANQYKSTSLLVSKIKANTPQQGYVFCDLTGNLNAIIQSAIPENTVLSGGLVVAVDTLTINSGDLSINTPGLQIIARSIQVDGQATLILPQNNSSIQLAAYEITGSLQATLDTGGITQKIGLSDKISPPQVATITSDLTTKFSNASNVIADILHSPWGILELDLSFAAASYLVEQGGNESLVLASNMIRWITGGCHALIKEKSNFSNLDIEDLVSLQTNSVSLLSFTQAAASGATYVPVLSAENYQTEINALLKIAEVYDQKIQEFEQEQNLEKLLGEFASTLKTINQDAETPLYNSLIRLDNEAQLVQTQLVNAAVQLQNISETFEPLEEAVYKAIEDQFQAELAELAIKTFFTVLTLYISAGAAIAGEPEILAGESEKILAVALEIAEKLAEVGEQLISGAIQTGTTSASGAPTLDKVKNMEQGANALMGGVASFGEASVALWTVVNIAIAQGQGKINFSPPLLKMVEKLPDLSGFSIGGVDPTTYWEGMVTQVKASVAPFKDGKITGPPVTAYLEAVELASAYGKGIGDLQMKALDLYNQGINAFDRLRAVHQAEEQWNDLKSKLDTQEAKAAAAKGFLQDGFNQVKRNIIVAVNNYRSAFLYQWLQPSSVSVDISMDYLELVQAAENSVTGLQKVLAGKSNGVVRPRQDFNNLEYIINRDENPLFKSVKGKGQAQWKIDLSDTELASQINGNTAIFIEEATFVLHGATQSGEVELQIETASNYGNKLGSKAYRFVTSPITMASDYTPGNPPVFKAKWKFEDAASYLKPSPYTQWTLRVDNGNWEKVSSIKMTISGIFLQNP